MLSDRTVRFLLAGFLCFVFCGSCPVEGGTLHLKDGMEWQDVSSSPEGRYLMAVAKFKQLVSLGNSESAVAELVKLKEAHPEMAGPDFDLFVEAELLFAEGKWNKAVDKYDQLLDGWPDSWLDGTAMEREYSIAVAYLNGQKRKVLKVIKLGAFDEGEGIMRRLADRAGDAPIAERALIALAKGYQKRKEFLDAYEVWSDIKSRWPGGEIGRTALIEMAQSLHSAYMGPHYDSTSLASAKTYYTNFRLLYPEVAADYEIDEKLTTIDEQLAYKQYSIGAYYERTGSPEAAHLYFDKVVKGWPGTSAAEMAQARIDAREIGIPKRESEPTKLGQALFNVSNGFVDSWFGATYLTGKGTAKSDSDSRD